jgi:hypothetical protein
MMKFQRQGCVLSNDYKELSITETPSLYILLGSWFGPVGQGRVAPRDSERPCPPRQGRSRDLGFYLVQGGMIGPRVVRWYKATAWWRVGS